MFEKNWESYKDSVHRLFYNDKGMQTFISYFDFADGIVTAAHCVNEIGQDTKAINGKSVDKWDHRMKGVDISTYGFKDLCPYVTKPYLNQQIVVLGYPAGSRNLEVRHGWVHMEREKGIFIGAIKRPAEPVVVGMSGGLVIGLDKDTMKWTPIGTTIHRNSPATLDKDDIPDESCDFVSLSFAFEENFENSGLQFV